MNNFLFYFLLFLIYSSLGWIMEVISTSIRTKKIVNRGFLMGPYCPIYGSASILMIFYLNKYKEDILTVFLLAFLICSFIEYLVSFIMEKLFNARWWDYSNRKFNINGRVCLSNAFAFGFLGVLMIYYINPFINNLLIKINTNLLNIISLILLFFFSLDALISFTITFKLKSSLEKLKKDRTEDISKKVKETIENKILNRRILNAFPKFKLNILSDKLKIEKRKKEVN